VLDEHLLVIATEGPRFTRIDGPVPLVAVLTALPSGR
jgi:hypothetical protein